MHEALREVKRALGEDAVILGTRSVAERGVGGLVGRQVFEITAAPPEVAATAPRVRRAARPATGGSGARSSSGETARERLDALAVRLRERPPKPRTPAPSAEPPATLTDEVYALYQRLVSQEVGEELARRIVQQALSGRVAARTARDTVEAGGNAGAAAASAEQGFRDAIARMLPTVGGIQATPGQCRRVAFVGPAGAGKTTTIAKLAAHFRLRERLNVAIVSLDIYGLARHDAVRRYAEIIGVALHTPQTIGEVRATSRQVGDSEVVLIDTCGVGGRDRGRVVRLAAMLRALRCDERHLVLPASMSATAQSRAAATVAPLAPTRLVLTRLDELVGMGVVLNAAQRLDLALSYVTDGQSVPRDLREARGDELAARLLCAAD